MKVLFVASNPSDRDTLNLEREITELQRRALEAAGEPALFTFLPGLRVEGLPEALGRHAPDVLHISAHGVNQALSLTNDADQAVRIDSKSLMAFLDDRPPRLVYLNACNSQEIARGLARAVPCAIGMTAPISNRAARAGAVVFYERLLLGKCVQAAFRSARKMVEIMQSSPVTAKLFHRSDIDPRLEIFHEVPCLLAKLVNGSREPGSDKFDVIFGLRGCPAGVTQVVFFTDDLRVRGSQRNASAGTLESDLCLLTQARPDDGVIWTNREDRWEVSRDFRLFAVGVQGNGATFSLGSTLCKALTAFASWTDDEKASESVGRATAALYGGRDSAYKEPGARKASGVGKR